MRYVSLSGRIRSRVYPDRPNGCFSYKQQHDNWRLACQVKVKENIEMHIPEEVLGIKKCGSAKWFPTEISTTFLKEFVVKLPEGWKT